MSKLKINQAPVLPQEPRPIVSIGAGAIVKDNQQPAYRKAGFRTHGIFDLDQGKAKAVAESFTIEHVFSSLEEAALKAPDDAVFDVAVPATAIIDILKVLPDGAAVLIQKPMGDTFKQAKTIREICYQKNLTAALNFQMRYAPFSLAAASFIEQGLLGEIHDIEVRIKVDMPWHLWPFMEALPRVEIPYHSIHYLDIMRSFLGEPKGMYAKTTKSPKTLHLASTRSSIILDYGETLRATITANHGHDFGSKHHEYYMTWEGTRGAIRVDMGIGSKADHFEYCLLEEGIDPVWQQLELEGNWFPDAFIGPMANLMCYLEGSSPNLITNIDDAFKTMLLVEAAHRSSDGGGIPILL